MSSRRRLVVVSSALAVTLLVGCGGSGAQNETIPSSDASLVAPTPSEASSKTPEPSTPTVSTPTASTPTPTATPALGTVPPSWLGTRVLPKTAAGFGVARPTPPELRNRRFTLPDAIDPLPGTAFASQVTSPAPARVISRSTWRPGCPVDAADLSWIRLTFWGFDDRRHTGELLVNTTVAADLVIAFRALYKARYPIEEMRITTKAEQTAEPTGDGNNTGAFNCRPVVGETFFSQHAYGLAVDVNPFQNPYEKGNLLLPELAGSYADRTRLRPGMILADGPVVRAFSSIGWPWGGTWRTAKDRHHFSANGR